MSTCLYCRRPGATFRVNADELAHQACAYAADDADQAAMFAAMRLPLDVELLPAPRIRQVRPVEDLAGRRFGHLTALTLEPLMRGQIPRREWRCRCDCGEELFASASRLRLGEVKACVQCSRKVPRSPLAIEARALGVSRKALWLRRYRARRAAGEPRRAA